MMTVINTEIEKMSEEEIKNLIENYVSEEDGAVSSLMDLAMNCKEYKGCHEVDDRNIERLLSSIQNKRYKYIIICGYCTNFGPKIDFYCPTTREDTEHTLTVLFSKDRGALTHLPVRLVLQLWSDGKYHRIRYNTRTVLIGVEEEQ